MGYYQVGYDRTQSSQCNTFITLINSSEKSFLGGENETIFVYTLFFDDNEKYLGCHQHKLTPDDMVVLNVEEILHKFGEGPPYYGVFKSVALDSQQQKTNTLVGFQAKQYYNENELLASTETGLFAVLTKFDIEKVISVCKGN